MAADPKKANKDRNEKEADEENQNAETGSGQKKKKLFIMIGIGVLLMGLSIGGTLLAVNMMSSDKKSDSVAEESDEESEEVDEETPAAPAIYYTMQPNFTVNFNVDGRQRYLQAEITLLYRNPEIDALLKLHMPAIRNQLVMLLSGKSFDELQNPDSREKLKVESMAAIQSILDKENAALKEKSKSDDEEDEKESDEEDENEETEKTPPLVIEQVLFTKFVMQ